MILGKASLDNKQNQETQETSFISKWFSIDVFFEYLDKTWINLNFFELIYIRSRLGTCYESVIAAIVALLSARVLVLTPTFR